MEELASTCSPIRPRDTVIHGTGGKATGSTSLMEILDTTGSVMKDGGGRRAALMFGLHIDHGDIQEFLDKKLDLNELKHANCSVIFNRNPEEFFEKVRNNEELELKFNGNVIKKVSAKKIWNKIVSNALKNGEPGILNSYYANKMSNIWYVTELICTNPCGEVWLSAKECCDLGSLVLPRFVTPTGKISWSTLRDTIHTAVRFLDNVLTVNHYPLPEIEEVCSNLRRVGLGITGLHDMLLLCGLKYNSPEGLELVNKVMKFIKNEAYGASINLAAEKGSFAKFDPEKFVRSSFVKTLKPTIRKAILEKGIRNCAHPHHCTNRDYISSVSSYFRN